MRTETPWGHWDPLTPQAVAELFKDAPFLWWVAGGYAIEAFAGRTVREHADIDLGIFRDDEAELHRRLDGWDAHCADPPGILRPWLADETLPARVHDIWVRGQAGGPWRFQFMINEREGTEWIYRRDARTRRDIAELTWDSGGVRYVAPEVQLLFKAKDPRPKDEVDFETAAPLLRAAQRSWLRVHLEREFPGHDWARRL